jgi:hypothetical protein
MEIWSWVLAAIGVSGIFFVGQKTIWGWLILLANECLWIIYAVTTQHRNPIPNKYWSIRYRLQNATSA